MFNHHFIPTYLALLCAALVSLNSVHALADQALRSPTLPGESCQIKPRGGWSSQEQWVWKQVCEGKSADFNTAKRYGGPLDPRKLEGWSDKRVLSPQFLETILLYEPFRSAIPRYGVRIIGGWFKEPIDLAHATLSHLLALGSCRFEANVRFDNLKASQLLILSGSKFTAPLNMRALQAESGIFMRDGAEFSEVDLRKARIRPQLDMNDSKFTALLNMNDIYLEGSLYMQKAEIAEANLISAKIDGQVIMNNSKSTGPLYMGSLQVGSSLLMEEVKFNHVDLRNAKIEQVLSMNGSNLAGPLILNAIEVEKAFHLQNGQIAAVNLVGARIGSGVLNGSRFTGDLNMNGLHVGGTLIMWDGEFADVDLRGAEIDQNLELTNSKFSGPLVMEGVHVRKNLVLQHIEVSENQPISLPFAEIGGSLFIENSTLPTFNLTGARIHGALTLGREGFTSLKWIPGSQLLLRNTEVGAIQDLENLWPGKLELDGFTYSHLGVVGTEGVNDAADRNADWYIDWLARQAKYSPQPYEQLESVLRKAGHSSKADEILYAERNRELGNTDGWLDWVWLFLQKVIIGFGYKTHRAILWLLGFMALGTFVLWKTGQGPAHGMPYGFSYSLDMLLPIVHLRKYHDEVDLIGCARYYFYVHKVAGFILVSFLIAGLAGLTK